MIDQQLIEMLDDPNPKIRADAVKQLAKTKSHDAVQYLAAVYKTDNDPEIRELARKAGLYIKKKMSEENWTGGEGDDSIDEPIDTPEEITVSPRAVEASKGHMDTAMNLHVSGEDEKASKFVEKAFTTNPNLKNDSYYLGMASTILGIPGDQVINMLLGDMVYDAKSGKAKRKRKTKPGDDEVSTEKVIIDLVIYFIVIAATIVIGMLILIQLLSGTFEAVMSSPEFTAELSASGDVDPQEQITLFMNALMGAGLISSIIYGVIIGVFSVIGLLIQYAFYHFSATSILGGNGSFKGLAHRLTNFYTVIYVISAIMMYVMMYSMFNTMMTDIANGIEPDIYEIQGTMNAISSLSFIFSLVMLYFLSSLIGKNYEFGTSKGCITVIISSVLMTALSCACIFVFSAALGQMMTSMMLSGS